MTPIEPATPVEPGSNAARALEALALFHPSREGEVRLLLRMWARNNTLTDADRRAVLDHYRKDGAR